MVKTGEFKNPVPKDDASKAGVLLMPTLPSFHLCSPGNNRTKGPEQTAKIRRSSPHLLALSSSPLYFDEPTTWLKRIFAAPVSTIHRRGACTLGPGSKFVPITNVVEKTRARLR